MVTALMLVFTLFSMLPQGALKASAAGSRYCFTDENGIEWTFTASGDIRFSDARIVSVRDTLGRDSDSDPTNDITELNVPDKVLDDYNSYTHAVTEIGCDYADNVPVPTF